MTNRVTTLAVAISLALGLAALSLPSAAGVGVVSERVSASASAQAAVINYWTADRIAAATAMVMIDRGDPNAMGSHEDEAATFDTGPAQATPAGRPAKDADVLHREAYPADWVNGGEDMGALYIEANPGLLGDAFGVTEEEALDSGERDAVADVAGDVIAGTSAIYTYYPVNEQTTMWKILPHKWEGKFTFTTPSGNASCSATAISNNHIVTAAHCVYDTPSRNAWYTNKAFTPAYRNGNAPYGTFATTACTVLTAWINLSGSYSINTWARHDVAVCDVGKNSLGQTLNAAVGWAGRSWNYGYNQLHFNAGYPANNYADVVLASPAQYLRSCTAESFQQTTETLGMGCYWGRGISGGAWLRNYKPGYSSGNVNSVNSGLYIGTQNMYGPRFNSNNIVALCTATGC